MFTDTPSLSKKKEKRNNDEKDEVGSREGRKIEFLNFFTKNIFEDFKKLY